MYESILDNNARNSGLFVGKLMNCLGDFEIIKFLKFKQISNNILNMIKESQHILNLMLIYSRNVERVAAIIIKFIL